MCFCRRIHFNHLQAYNIRHHTSKYSFNSPSVADCPWWVVYLVYVGIIIWTTKHFRFFEGKTSVAKHFCNFLGNWQLKLKSFHILNFFSQVKVSSIHRSKSCGSLKLSLEVTLYPISQLGIGMNLYSWFCLDQAQCQTAHEM